MFASFLRKNDFVFLNQIWHFKALNQYLVAQNIRFRLLTDFKTNLQETETQREKFWRVSMFALLSRENGFVFVNQTCHFKALNQYSVAQKIRFRLLIDFETNLQESQLQRKSFQRLSRFAWLSQKNGFVFVNQIWLFKALN